MKGRINSIITKLSGNDVQKLSYTFDDLNLINSIEDEIASKLTSFKYDSFSQLIESKTVGLDSELINKFNFKYDDLGNRVEYENLQSSDLRLYASNNLNQYEIFEMDFEGCRGMLSSRRLGLGVGPAIHGKRLGRLPPNKIMVETFKNDL